MGGAGIFSFILFIYVRFKCAKITYQRFFHIAHKACHCLLHSPRLWRSSGTLQIFFLEFTIYGVYGCSVHSYKFLETFVTWTQLSGKKIFVQEMFLISYHECLVNRLSPYVTELYPNSCSKIGTLAPPPEWFWRGKNTHKSKSFGLVTDLAHQNWPFLRL